MSILDIDKKGRLTFPKRLREALNIGNRVLVINAGDHLKIIPLPPDPFEILNGTLNIKKSFKELREEAEATAQEEAKRGLIC